jgi:hypothetical protein
VSTGPDSEYNLYDEVQQLASGRSYRGGTGYNETIWYEDATQVQDASPPNDGVIFPRLPWLKKPLYVDETWIRYQVIDTSTGRLLYQTSAKVLGQVEIATKAGTFQATKLVLYSLSGSPPELSNEFEYYVPGVGLVLYEVDREVCRSIVRPQGGGYATICFRQVIRKELTSYNVLP